MWKDKKLQHLISSLLSNPNLPGEHELEEIPERLYPNIQQLLKQDMTVSEAVFELRKSIHHASVCIILWSGENTSQAVWKHESCFVAVLMSHIMHRSGRWKWRSLRPNKGLRPSVGLPIGLRFLRTPKWGFFKTIWHVIYRGEIFKNWVAEIFERVITILWLRRCGTGSQ